jgi:hypothetical protein
LLLVAHLDFTDNIEIRLVGLKRREVPLIKPRLSALGQIAGKAEF